MMMKKNTDSQCGVFFCELGEDPLFSYLCLTYSSRTRHTSQGMVCYRTAG